VVDDDNSDNRTMTRNSDEKQSHKQVYSLDIKKPSTSRDSLVDLRHLIKKLDSEINQPDGKKEARLPSLINQSSDANLQERKSFPKLNYFVPMVIGQNR
jgi:hypothetical protein